MSSLNGKVIVVTGGASGIGLATVQRLLSLGALVAVADLPKTTPETLESLKPSREYFFYQSTDVASRTSCASFIDHVIQKFGRVDGLVNNAGVIPYEGEMASDEL
jgi:NAD(P)-dependent dehydrogenase (short-subunit alcohol dehydrogenase family)